MTSNNKNLAELLNDNMTVNVADGSVTESKIGDGNPYTWNEETQS